MIASHLGDVDLDDEKLAELMAVPSADPWEGLDALRLTPEQARDSRIVADRLEQARKLFGFERWRPGQHETMARFIADEDVLSVLPTGIGQEHHVSDTGSAARGDHAGDLAAGGTPE